MALFQEAWTFVICKLVKTDMRDEPAMQCRIKALATTPQNCDQCELKRKCHWQEKQGQGMTSTGEINHEFSEF